MSQQVDIYEWRAVIVRRIRGKKTYLLIGYITGEETLIAKVLTRGTHLIAWMRELDRQFTFRHAMQSLKDSGFDEQAGKIKELIEGGYTGEIVKLQWDFLPDFK